METKYSKSFKIESVKKYFNRRAGDGYSVVATQLGVSKSTLHTWVKNMKNKKPEAREKEPVDWSSSEKLNAILEVQNMNEEEISSYCRSKGIFPHHLEKWKQEFRAAEKKTRSDLSETRALKAENKLLKKELRRKDKALAEAAALLILKKKAQEIWGSDEDD